MRSLTIGRHRDSRVYRAMTLLRRPGSGLAPRGSRRERCSGPAGDRCTETSHTCGVCRWRGRARAAGQRLGLWLAPSGSSRERCLRKASQKIRRTRCRIVSQPGIDLAEVLRQTVDRKGIVIYPPFIDWDWMRSAAAPIDGPVRRRRLPFAVLLAKGPIRLFRVHSGWTSGCTCATRSIRSTSCRIRSC